jgi:hypothetical protein
METVTTEIDEQAAKDYIKDYRSENGSGSDENKHSNAEHGDEYEEQQTGVEELSNKVPGKDDLVYDDPRTEGQIRHNLRPNRERNYSNQLGHIMDNPAGTKSYDAQFFQHGKDDAPTL